VSDFAPQARLKRAATQHSEEPMRRLLPSLLLVWFVGCGAPRLNQEKNFDVDFGGTTYQLDAVKVEQKVTVEATALGGANIDVYIFLTKNEAAAKKDIEAKKLGGLIASAEAKSTVTLMGTIPAREEWSVLVRSSTPKKAAGTIKIKN
jgi:hypothetical protein